MPQVTDRIKEAPATALRAVFAGIGQVLLAADKIRGRGSDQGPGPHGKAAAPDASLNGERPEAAGDTGDVRLLTGRETTADKDAERTAGAGAVPAPEAAAAKPSTAKAGTAKPGTAKAGTAKGSTAKAGAPVASTATPTAAPAAEPGDAPIPGYDELTVASLRARMRSMNVADLHALLSYERAHASRDTVIAMFERRIAKIESGEG